MMVLWHYVLLPVDGLAKHLSQSSAGVSGVDLFLVSSGFIMVLTTNGRATTPWEFMKRRIIRVVPPYGSLTQLVLVLVTVIPWLFKTTQALWWHRKLPCQADN